MKTNLMITICFFLLKNISFSQCDVNILGSDFAWCTPCEGTAFANATGGTAPYTYNWSTGDTTAFINNICAGTYFVEVTDDLGCVVTDSVTINPIGTPMTLNMTATAPSCPTCCNICVNPNPTGGCAPYNILWSQSDPNWPPFSACPFETYIVTVTDACGCSVSDSLTTDTVAVGTTGIHQIEQIEIGVYPNPANSFITVAINNFKSTYTATITDIQGNVIYSTILTTEKTIIKTDELTTGIYLISITDNSQKIYTKKWIKE